MKIVLAYLSGLPDRSDPYISLLPVGLCSLQASLRSCGYDAVLANYSGWSEDDILQHINDLKPLFVGISIWTHNRHASLALARMVKKMLPGTLVFAGGAHATFRFKQLLLLSDSPFDGVVLGEGEETLKELANCIEAGSGWKKIKGVAFRSGDEILATSPRPSIQQLDQLPFVSTYLEFSVGVDSELQAEFVLTSRGCPSACTFCSSPAFWSRRVRFRSPESIVDEIAFIRDRYGLIYFSFRDDTFTVDRERTIEFCRLLVERKIGILWNCQSRVNVLDKELLLWMKRGGCECVQLGVESASPRILEQLGKTITPEQVERAADLIRECGINLSVYLISDVPDETEEDLQATFSLIRTIRPDDGYVSPLAYFPGTKLFEQNVVAGVTDIDLFESDPAAALFVVGKTANSKRILKALARNRPTKNAKYFKQEKERNGYCFTSNILSGEWFRQNGDFVLAEAEFKEICTKDKEIAWGRFLLAELYREKGRAREAAESYQKVIEIVPKHKPSLEYLQKKDNC